MLLEQSLPAALGVATTVASPQQAPQSRRHQALLIAAPQALVESQETSKAAFSSARGLLGDCSQIFHSQGSRSVWHRGPVLCPLCQSSELCCRLPPRRNVMVAELPGVQGQCTGQATQRALFVHLLPAFSVCTVDKQIQIQNTQLFLKPAEDHSALHPGRKGSLETSAQEQGLRKGTGGKEERSRQWKLS